MILFIGELAVLMFIFEQLSCSFEMLFTSKYKEWILLETQEIRRWIFPSVINGLGRVKWTDEIINFSVFWRTQIFTFRKFLFSIPQFFLSYALILLIIGSSLEINSVEVMSFFSILWLIVSLFFPNENTKKNRSVYLLKAGIFFGLSLFILEYIAKTAMMWTQDLLDTSIVFWLTDSRWPSLAAIFIFGMSVTLLFRKTAWSLFLCFILLVSSQISFMGCVALVISEFVGNYLWLFFKLRKMDDYYFRRIRSLWIGLVLLNVFIFLALINLRQSMSLTFSYEDLASSKWNFIYFLLCILLLQYMFFMVWGHFASRRKDENIVMTDSQISLVQFENLDDVSKKIVILQLDQRLKKFLNYKLSLDDISKTKIPIIVLDKFESEFILLEKYLKLFGDRFITHEKSD